MSTVQAVRRARAEGGPRELARRTARWLAARGRTPAPTPAPTPARARRKAAPRPAPRATDVDHARALAWFDRRREVYDGLAAAAAPYVEPDGTFLDVGANIGYFTRVLAERTGFRGTVHLFEPIPHLASLATRTLADVPYRAVVHPFGLSDEDAELDIYVSGDGNLGWNTMVAAKAGATMRPERIAVRRFDGLGLPDLDPEVVPSFVKVDVEGAEHRVLAGMLGALTTWPSRPVILCEVGWGSGHPDWAAELAVFERLAGLGYRTVDLDRQPLDVTTLERTTDVLFLPDARATA
jgi:FkbM family methyltransferase